MSRGLNLRIDGDDFQVLGVPEPQQGIVGAHLWVGTPCFQGDAKEPLDIVRARFQRRGRYHEVIEAGTDHAVLGMGDGGGSENRRGGSAMVAEGRSELPSLRSPNHDSGAPWAG